MSIKFLALPILGGGVFWVGGGGSADFIFMGAGIFSDTLSYSRETFSCFAFPLLLSAPNLQNCNR